MALYARLLPIILKDYLLRTDLDSEERMDNKYYIVLDCERVHHCITDKLFVCGSFLVSNSSMSGSVML
jgi:hypothetical protein